MSFRPFVTYLKEQRESVSRNGGVSGLYSYLIDQFEQLPACIECPEAVVGKARLAELFQLASVAVLPLTAAGQDVPYAFGLPMPLTLYHQSAAFVQLTRQFPGLLSELPDQLCQDDKLRYMYQLILKKCYDVDTVKKATLSFRIRKTPGANDVNVSIESGNPEVRVETDREKMAKLGLNIATVGGTLQNAFAGNDDSKFRDGGEDYDIRVMLDAFDRKNPDDVKNINFFSPAANRPVRLAEFATVSLSNGPSLLERKNRRSAVTVTANTLGTGSGTLTAAIRADLAKNPLPAGVSVSWGGDAKNQEEGFGSLGLAMLVGIMLAYFIMVLLYDSFIYPLVVMFSVPVALIGALLVLALTSSDVGIFSMLGFLMLIGLVIKNAILIVDFANQQKAQGVPYRQAILHAGQERLRPILMTTLAMVIGMIPIATASGSGAEWKNSLAWVLIGGLSSSMILTIFLVPMVYYLVDRTQEWFAGRFGKKTTQPVPEAAMS